VGIGGGSITAALKITEDDWSINAIFNYFVCCSIITVCLICWVIFPFLRLGALEVMEHFVLLLQ
jgi:hypothetical protein